MAKQKFALGRGLDALIPGANEARSMQQSSSIAEHSMVEVAIESIIPNPRQPRRFFREDDPKLLELSNSIKEFGLLQPLIVTRLDRAEADDQQSPHPRSYSSDTWFAEDTSASNAPLSPTHATGATNRTATAGQRGYGASVVQFQIIAGERRWRAARLAGLTKVPVIIKDVAPLEMLELALIENIQRADLNAIEEALAYQTLIQEFGLTQEMVAQQVGKNRSTITNAIRLLQLPPKVREALIQQPEYFSEGHARTLIGIASEEAQITAMGKIITQRLNVRQAEELAARIRTAERADTAMQRITSTPDRSADLDDLETQFRNALTVKVDLKCTPKGKGTLVLHFNNQDELDRLYSRLVKHEE